MNQLTFDLEFKGEVFKTHYIKESSDAEVALGILNSSSCTQMFGLDIETYPIAPWENYPKAGLDPHLAKIRLLQVYSPHLKQIFVFDLLTLPGEGFISFLDSHIFVAHNAKFEMSFLRQLGCKQLSIDCSMIMFTLLAHATYPTDEGISYSLEAITSQLLKADISKASQMSDWSNPDLLYQQVSYAALDALLPFKLLAKMYPLVRAQGMSRVHQLYTASQAPIVSMQLNGMGLDVKTHKKYINEWRKKIFDSKLEVQKVTGLTDLTSNKLSLWLEKTLDKETLLIWPRTPKGKLQTDAHAFAEFAYLPMVKPYAVFQEMSKACASFGQNLIDLINPVSGKIHSNFKICGARTGRLSCSQPNCQQYPADKEFRKLFVADPGYRYVVSDFNQIEIRVIAELSQDVKMLEAYKTGMDLHRLTASKLLGIPLDKVSSEQRKLAKAIRLGLLYGLSHKKFAHYLKLQYGIEISEAEAEKLIFADRELYSGLRQWQVDQSNECQSSFIAKTVCGKIRRLNEDNAYGGGLNTPCQGTSAEITHYALCGVEESLREFPEIKLINCVHDEIILQVPDDQDYIDLGQGILETEMEKAYLEVFPNGIIKNLVETKSGYNWAEAK